jgi:hypothetical protein
MIGAVVAVHGFNGVSELFLLLSQSVGLVSGDEYQFWTLDSVGDGLCRGYGDVSIALYAAIAERRSTEWNGSEWGRWMWCRFDNQKKMYVWRSAKA